MLGQNRHIEDLILFKNLIEEVAIDYVIYFGTLLGARRNGALIPWDDDVDFVLYGNLSKVSSLELLLKDSQFIKIRHEGDIVTYKKSEVRFDLYIFNSKPMHYRCNDYIIPKKYLKSTDCIEMYGVDFSSPTNVDGVLEQLYGKNWKIPKKDCSASPVALSYKVKLFLKDRIIPSRLYSFIKSVVRK